MSDEIIEETPNYLKFIRSECPEKVVSYYNVYYFLVYAWILKLDIETALVQAQEMYDDARTMNSNEGMALALFVMSDVYNVLDRDEEREKTLRDAIDLFEKTDPAALIYMQEVAYAKLLVDILLSQNRLDEAREMIPKYKKIVRYVKDILKRELPPHNFWEINVMYHLKTGEYDTAEMYCDSLDRAATAHWRLKGLIYKMEIFAGRKQYDKALAMIDSIFTTTNPDEIEAANFNYIRRHKMEILAKTGQTDELLKLALYTIDSNDSLYRKDLEYQIDELRTRYDVDKHVSEMKYMRRYASIATVAGVLLIIMLAIWIYYSRVINRKNRGLMRKISEQDMLFAELERRREQERERYAHLKPDDDGDDTKIDDLFDKIDRLMKERRIFADSQISRKSVAEMIGINERTLFDCIKNNTEKNFSDYITFLRLNYARELLAGRNEKLTMEAIADEAGFGSRASFYRLFKTNYGLSPDEFRKLTRIQMA